MKGNTSLESVFEGVGVINLKSFLGATGKAALILVKAYI
jgi:hypothetical protein